MLRRHWPVNAPPVPPGPLGRAGWYTGRVVATQDRVRGPLQWTLPPGPEAVSAVRHRLHALLVDLPHVQLDDVLLVASEVVTNAVLHGDGPVAIRVSMRGRV